MNVSEIVNNLKFGRLIARQGRRESAYMTESWEILFPACTQDQEDQLYFTLTETMCWPCAVSWHRLLRFKLAGHEEVIEASTVGIHKEELSKSPELTEQLLAILKVCDYSNQIPEITGTALDKLLHREETEKAKVAKAKGPKERYKVGKGRFNPADTDSSGPRIEPGVLDRT